jgi:hypothetical protein
MARGADRRWEPFQVREMALADIAEAVEDFDVSPQVRCSFAERKLGYHGGPLRRQVNPKLLCANEVKKLCPENRSIILCK